MDIKKIKTDDKCPYCNNYMYDVYGDSIFLHLKCSCGTVIEKDGVCITPRLTRYKKDRLIKEGRYVE